MHKWQVALLIYLISGTSVLADGGQQFITVVNPVRISQYNPDPVASLRAQYSVIEKYRFSATWLLTYDVLNHPNLVKEVKKMDKQQELGIFLEVTPEFAKAAGVEYQSTGSWHFADAVFLSGYEQSERIKFIDTAFAKFKQEFGYYPVSVGAWWVDSFSLQYMHDKYWVIANLGVADQYSTDNYQVWGTYWSAPYYPNKIHAGIPADDVDNKIGVVTLQWAARHPRQGYHSSLYSTQDYFTTKEKYGVEYFEKLINLYLEKGENQFSQITVGLEGDFGPDVYSGEYARQMKVISQKNVTKVTMGEFTKWYTENFPYLSPAHKIEADGVVWYQSPRYRIGVDKTNHKIIDLRVYARNYMEPYYLWPDREKDLRIYIPSVIDSLQNPAEAWDYGGGEVKFSPDHFEVVGSRLPLPGQVDKSIVLRKIAVKEGWSFSPMEEWPVSQSGIIIKDWKLETKHLLTSPKMLIRAVLQRQWDMFQKDSYWVSQGETEALERLRLLPGGGILVYDQECLQCPWYGKFRPAVFANVRGYVGRYARKPIIYNSSVFKADNRPTAKKQLQRSKAKYVYLVKYDKYQENLPFSPGDLGVEKIFENAVSTIWEVVK